MSPTCNCGHPLHKHYDGHACLASTGLGGCSCTEFVPEGRPPLQQRPRRRPEGARDEVLRRLAVLRERVMDALVRAQSNRELPKGPDAIIVLTDRVVDFVLRASATSCEYAQLVSDLTAVLSEPVDYSGGDKDGYDGVPFPRALALDLMDTIVEAAHLAHDTVFQEMA